MAPLSVHTLVALAVLAGLTVHFLYTTLRIGDLTHPLVLVRACFAYFVVVPGCYLLLTGQFRKAHSDPQFALSLALALLTVAYGTILIGYRSVPDGLLERIEGSGQGVRRPDPGTIRYAALLALVVGIVSYVAWVELNGGFLRLLFREYRLGFQRTPNTARFRILGLGGIFSALVLSLAALDGRSKSSGRRAFRERDRVLFAGAFAVALAVALLRRERMVIAFVLFYPVVYWYSTRELPFRRFLKFAAGALAVVASFSFVEGLLLGRATLRSLIWTVVNPARLENLMVVLTTVPESFPHLYGRTIVRAVPTVESYPKTYEDVVEILVVGRDRPSVSLSAMSFGQAYLAFGVPGVVAFSVLFGVLLRIVRSTREINYVFRAAYPALTIALVSVLPTSIPWGVLTYGYSLVFVLSLVLVWVHVLQPFAAGWVRRLTHD